VPATRLNVWLEAFDQPVGRLERLSNGNAMFRYAEDHVADPAAVPLSLSLPLRREIFDDVATRAWFDNLIQENDSLDQLMAREQIERSDIVSLLSVIGADCPGAVSCLPDDSPPVKRPGVLGEDYEALAPEGLARVMRSLADTGRSPGDSADPSPVAGVQPKVAVTMLSDGRLAFPKPGQNVPTTHILKVPRRRDERDVHHEAVCMKLAVAVGIDAAEVAAIDLDGVKGLLIERFDRLVIDGKAHRLHQEDFAQALGLSAQLKYERRGGSVVRFDIHGIARLMRATANPVRETERFIDLTLFNLVIGNVDNHAKNHALLSLSGRMVFAPAYDLLPTRLNQGLTDEFSFRIGSATRLADITKDDLLSFAAAFGIRGRGAERVLEQSARRVILPLIQPEVIALIAREDGKRLADHIAHAARHIRRITGWEWLAVPERDAFISEAAGWLQS
jgi:serine/threonine-protein kinase HipA